MCFSVSSSAEANWQLLGSFNKDPSIFTQGLEINQGNLWYSSGRYGKSFLLEQPLNDSKQSTKHPLPSNIFAEGLSIHNNTLTLLTWKAGKAYQFSASPFKATGSKRYAGEGWGLCHDNTHLWMSNGSETLYQRKLTDFTITSYIQVTYKGEAISRLNELECFNGLIAANQWKTNYVFFINPKNGEVIQRIDFSQLKAMQNGGVLNGIAWHANSKELLVTGKNWDRVYRVKILVDSLNTSHTSKSTNAEINIKAHADTIIQNES